jgi:hypothetical protein
VAVFTEYCCRSGGSNLNPGTRTGSSTEPGLTADLTYPGSWDETSRVFTVTSGNPLTGGVTTNDIAAISIGNPTWEFLARVATVSATTIGLDSSKSTQTTLLTGNNFTLRIGGAMAGPSAGSAFPLDQRLSYITNLTSDPVRLNMKNDQTYAMTSSITMLGDGPPNVHGYGTTYGDGGQATISGPTVGTGYLAMNCGLIVWLDSLIIKNNGATGSPFGLYFGYNAEVTRVVIRDMMGCGISSDNGLVIIDECEIFNCNANSTTSGAILVNSGAFNLIHNSIIHNNLGFGIRTLGDGISLVNTIIDSNAMGGVSLEGTQPSYIEACDFYNNPGNGITGITSPRSVIKNSNFIKNSGWGIGGTAFLGLVRNCGFGSGTMANGSGTIQSTRVVESGRITYGSGATPWNNPTTGDFRIALSTAKGSGRRFFMQTASGYTGTVGYPDVGAAQHQDVSTSNLAF